MRTLPFILGGLLALAPALLAAQTATSAPATTTATTGASTASSNPVVVSGTLPNEDMRAKVLERLRKIYGNDRVVDHLEIGTVVAPGNWDQYLGKMIRPDLQQIHHGKITVQGNEVHVSGDVDSEQTKQHMQDLLSHAFDGSYQLHSSLHVVGQSQQKVLDDALANRVVQFESGSAVLTADGRAVLDQMATAITKLKDPPLVIVGNTDSSGNRQANIMLSLQRATAVRDYLVSKQIPVSTMSVSGNGPDHPIADNSTAEGRARNRRIDFKILR